MRIQSSERVRYEINPLLDVTAQVRFPSLLGLDDALAAKMQQKVARGFPIVLTEDSSLQAAVAIGNNPAVVPQNPGNPQLSYRFSSIDQQKHIVLARDSLTFTDTKYGSWESFRDELKGLIAAVEEFYSPSTVVRIGLRYRDVIDRKILFDVKVPWDELIRPFVLGGFGTSALFDSDDFEAKVKRTLTISDFELDGYSLQLRHGLATKAPDNRQCFLIDGDYYASDARAFVTADIVSVFERLHEGAGSVFRGCISPKLHDALRPVPVGTN